MPSYRYLVWDTAVRDAELDVMRHTATIVGGRKQCETLMAYVERAKKLQDEAIDRYHIACAERTAARGGK